MQFLEDKSIGTSVCLLDKSPIKVVVTIFIALFYLEWIKIKNFKSRYKRTKCCDLFLWVKFCKKGECG